MARAIITVLFALCLSSVVFATATPGDLRVRISSDAHFYAPGKELVINFEIANPTDEDIHVLEWNTPLEGVKSRLFDIQMDDGTRPTYTGMLLKRAEPVLAHYVRIAAQSSVSGSLDISDSYRFAKNGQNSIRLAFKASNRFSSPEWLVSNAVRVEVVNVHLYAEEAVPNAQLAVGYTGCSLSEQNIVETAIPQATNASLNALNYLNEHDCDADYVTWFGTYSNSRWNKVDTDFTNIHAQFVSLEFNINCECSDPFTYAYVYPGDPTHTIHLCGAFWNASPHPYVYDSQPGTLTHEMSHFNDIAGTDDIVYGTSGCRALASSSPNEAVDNADSHEYFQESEPTC